MEDHSDMTIYYISPSGSDSTGAGTLGNPWATLSKFRTSMTAGDTCILLDGVYTHANNFSQAFTAACTLQAQNRGAAIIDGAFGYSAGLSLAATTTISGLCFTRFSSATTGYILAAAANSVTLNVQNCKIYSTGGSGGLFGNGGGIIGCTSPGYTNVTLNVIASAFYDIYNYNGVAATSCIFRPTNGVGGALNITACVIALSTPGGSNTNLTSAIICGSPNNTTQTIKNSIFYRTGNTDALSYSNTTALVRSHTYSCFYGSWTYNTVGTGSITTDPLFVDPANFNFNLRPASPCIDTGTLV